MMPPTRNSHLFDRIDVFVQLDELLTPDAGDALQSVALYGLGGVGKTSIASSYAEKKFFEQIYDVVLWVCAETEASLKQSFTDIAMRLKLNGAQPQTHDEIRSSSKIGSSSLVSQLVLLFLNRVNVLSKESTIAKQSRAQSASGW